ncbi:MAG: preprotein translocase subunit YajC [Gammaproteobacteria bacterium]|nr:MAG: preprotein translocase subunit YajC [Gammaproteobacteria bacterium]
MSFFISDAYAAGESAVQPGIEGLIFPVVLIAIFYFMLIRPQQKRAKEQKKLVEELNKGDELITSGGLLGKIVAIDENFIQLEIAKEMVVSVQRNSVATVMPKGTIKGLGK